ncbi:hypothetical protein J1605_013947 [Eschrichtius robustus]|uniref:Uncharacterized protein n=1 Tax=Eschrichtius robustus TaxID=9764 RepID=A0AB34GGA5_ESCRO|nr:hypothetical protein J1605_013947 [Eschrichtius robustus]
MWTGHWAGAAEAQLATGGLVDPIQGVRMAPELACQQSLLAQETWCGLLELGPGSSAPGFLDPNTLEQLPYRELLGRCVQAPSTGLGLLPLKVTFRTLSGALSLAELLEAGVLDGETARGLREGRLAVPDVGARTEVQRHLQGTGGVAGVVLLPAGHKKSFFQATAEHLLPMGATLPVLEAQDATCMLVDPATGRQLWVDVAVRAGLFGPELHRQLLAAEQVVTGYHDPFSGTRIPLFQAMKRELVDRPLALRLLVAQLATGGLVCLRAAVATVSTGTFQGRPVSLWELLFSEAVPVEQRVPLSQQHKDGALLAEELAAALRAAHEQAAATARTTFAG